MGQRALDLWDHEENTSDLGKRRRLPKKRTDRVAYSFRRNRLARLRAKCSELEGKSN